MLVSVVIPTYNRGHLIEKSIRSVIEQTYKNLEIIIVSDGSIDNTCEIVSEYKKKDSRIKFISYAPNRGGNYARNIGIKAARGDFIAFLDDDDEWFPDKLESQLKVFEKNIDIGLVYTGVEVIYSSKKKYVSLPQKIGDLSKEILIKNYIGITSTVMVKADILNTATLFDEKLMARQDYDLWIRICQVTKVGAVFKPLVKYNNHDLTAQISDDIGKYKAAINYIESKYIDLYNKYDKSLLDKHRQENLKILYNKAIRNKNAKKARNFMIKHFKIKPNLNSVIFYLLSFINYNFLIKLRSLIR